VTEIIGEPDRLHLGDPSEVQTAFLAASITQDAPNAGPFLEKIVWCYPLDDHKVHLEGPIAKEYKEEIIQCLEAITTESIRSYYLVPAARGLLRTLRD
jgi:hypothetical protein